MEGGRVWVWPSRSLLPLSESQNPMLKTYCTNEAGVVPGMTQGLDELVTSLHREIAAVALGAEQSDVV